jgi:chromosome segregation ATPase
MDSSKSQIQELLAQKNSVIKELSARAEQLRERRSVLTMQIAELNQCNISVQDYIDIACDYVDQENQEFVKRLRGSSGHLKPDSEGAGRVFSNPSFGNIAKHPVRIKSILFSALSQENNGIGPISPAIMYLFADEFKSGLTRMITELCSHYPKSFNETNRPLSEIQGEIDEINAQIEMIDAELAEITDQAAQFGEAI